jgi:beta-glucosidase
MSPALLNVLYGEVNPSGKLPVSLQNGDNDQQMTPEQYPGQEMTSTYTEKLEMGYRWYDAHDVEPLFPFGHGLSYTSFEYNKFEQDGRKISVQI